MMSDFKLKKTRVIVIASIFWVAFSFYLADTSGSTDVWSQPYFKGRFDISNIQWGIFFGWITPVWIYWAYDWINKGR